MRSDLSRFHGVRDLEELDAPRYFELASLLVHYDGALRHALIADHPEPSGPPPGHAGGPGVGPAATDQREPVHVDHPSQLPGITYRGG